MRNVAVGAGRRKNKHITNDNGIVLKFGRGNVSLDESRTPMLNLMNQKRNLDAGGGNNCRENGDEESSLCVSSVTNGYTRGNELSESEHNMPKHLQSYPSSSWIVPLNQRWNNVTSMVQSSMHMCNPFGIDPNAMQWCHAPVLAVTNILTPNIGLQFVPGSYGNGNVSIGSNGCISPSSSTTSNSFCEGNGSTIPSKQTRDSVLFDEEKS
ncbi:hypothetical protein RYX36_007698 [Vicia faba]